MPAALVVTTHRPTLDFTAGILSRNSIDIITAADANEAIRSLLAVSADVIVVDGLSVDAVALGREARSVSSLAPLVYITSAAEKWSRAAPRLSERDSVVSRPISEREMTAAVQLALGPTDVAMPGRLTIGDLIVDSYAMSVSGPNVTVSLTPTETRLMRCLARAKGEVVPVSALIRLVWGIEPRTGSRDMVRAHVRNLRMKLRRASGQDGLLETLPRQGYRLVSR
ncbi:MAG: response regulator transcription factor [Chloroflexi bacterium]|nr:response regulator transcription factor [Chloroflexota bacterium]